MATKTVKLGTRRSKLALAQTNLVASRLAAAGLDPTLVPIVTAGDQSLGGSAAQTKGAFTSELVRALEDHQVDLVVHSLKDLPLDDDPGISTLAVLERGPAADLLLLRTPSLMDSTPSASSGLEVLSLVELLGSRTTSTAARDAFELLSRGAKIGTSSPRRQSGALGLRPDLLCVAVRGAVDRRIELMLRGDADALILAEAGLARLADAVRQVDEPAWTRLRESLEQIPAVRLDITCWPGAPGQGALAVQGLEEGEWVDHPAVRALEHPATRAATDLERGLLRELGGGCSLPLGASATDDQLVASLARSDWREAAAVGGVCALGSIDLRLEEGPAQTTLRAAASQLSKRVADGQSPPERELVAPSTSCDLVVTSSPRSTKRLTRLLPEDVQVAALPCTTVTVFETPWPDEAIDLDPELGGRRTWPWVVVSSPNAARVLSEHSERHPIWARLPWCALGEGTARALLALGSPPNLVADARDGASLARFLADRLPEARAFFVPQSARSDATLSSSLRSRGRSVVAWNAYAVESLPKHDLRTSLKRGDTRQVILFTARSQVESFAAAELPWPDRCWALGEPTAAAVREHLARTSAGEATLDARVEVAPMPTAAGVLALWNALEHGSSRDQAVSSDPERSH